MTFLEKLNQLMEINHLNKNTLSKSCDIPYTTIDGWYKKGYEGLKLTSLRKLADFFGTSLDFWVSHDEGFPEVEDEPEMGDKQQKMLVLFDALSPPMQDCVINIARELLISQKPPKT